MSSRKNINKISNFKSVQKEFLDELHANGFKDAKIISDNQNFTINKFEDRELLIIK